MNHQRFYEVLSGEVMTLWERSPCDHLSFIFFSQLLLFYEKLFYEWKQILQIYDQPYLQWLEQLKIVFRYEFQMIDQYIQEEWQNVETRVEFCEPQKILYSVSQKLSEHNDQEMDLSKEISPFCLSFFKTDEPSWIP